MWCSFFCKGSMLCLNNAQMKMFSMLSSNNLEKLYYPTKKIFLYLAMPPGPAPCFQQSFWKPCLWLFSSSQLFGSFDSTSKDDMHLCWCSSLKMSYTITCSCVALSMGSCISVYILCNALNPPGKLWSWTDEKKRVSLTLLEYKIKDLEN